MFLRTQLSRKDSPKGMKPLDHLLYSLGGSAWRPIVDS